ncbi:MAG: transcriptional regulator, LuxR family [Ilumatobacteraceae bacterium]|nr:transcriptional regulator, LuxR family [Ilumatobacteraceae bacterium]
MGDGHIVGRERELRRGMAAADRDGCHGVVLVGAAGVGKSALAAALAGRLIAERPDTGHELVRISASPSATGIPLGAVAPLLAVPNAPTTQIDLIRHTVSALTARAGTRRLVVFVDDAHWLDDASATLVHQLAMTGSTFLVITVRAQEAVPDPITALWKDGLADRMDLAELGLAEATALAQSILGSPLHPSAAATLHDASAGNPLFVQQLVASARDAGVLALVAGRGPVAGGWQLIGPLPLPADLISAVEARLEHLDEDDRAVLELLALGEPLGAPVLEALVGEGAEQRLERLEADGFIRADLDRRRLEVRLGHPMYGEVLRAVMPTSWANRARIQLADAVAARGLRRRGDALRVAMWRLDAHATIPSAVAHDAAHQALRRFDPTLAERIVRQSDGGRGGERSASALSRAPADRFLLAVIAARSAQAEIALDHLDQLDELLDTIEHDGSLRAQATVLRFDAFTYILGRFEEAFALELAADADRSVGAALVARKAIVMITLGRPNFAAAFLATLDGQPLSTRSVVWVAVARAMTATSTGRIAAALELLDEADAAFERLGWDPSLPDPAIVSFVRIRTLQQDGRLPDAAAAATRRVDFQRDRWSEQEAAWHHMAASSVHRVQGRPLAAAEEARTAADTFTRSGSLQLAGVALAEVAAACATAGDGEGAEAAAQACDDLGVANFYGRYAHAWAVLGSGRITDGVAALVETLASRRARDAREELLLVLDIVGLGGAREVIDAARALAAGSDGTLAAIALRYATAAVDDDGDGLSAAAEELAGVGCTLAAAEAAHAACTAHLRNGDARRANAVAARARALRQELGEVRLPSLIPPRVLAILTPREREVVVLAAAGDTSASIAELLGLTQRTVESYVQNAYDKLGVTNRAELAATLSG